MSTAEDHTAAEQASILAQLQPFAQWILAVQDAAYFNNHMFVAMIMTMMVLLLLMILS